MKVGFLFEGDSEENTIPPLLRRISNIKKSDIVSFNARGSIEGKIEAVIPIFLENCDFALIMSDTEGDKNLPRRVKTKIQKLIKKLNRPTIPIVYSFPDPKIEKWFLDEGDCLKNIFGSWYEKTLPFDEIKDPKEQFKKLYIEGIKAISDPLTIPQLQRKLGEEMNLDKLVNNKSFCNFYKSLNRVLKSLNCK